MFNTQENDLMILRQLYLGLHLEPKELERAHKLLYLMNNDLNKRLKEA